ncbi:MAG: hypothetical protein ABL884_12720, partial [Methyloglobulus sp.]
MNKGVYTGAVTLQYRLKQPRNATINALTLPITAKTLAFGSSKLRLHIYPTWNRLILTWSIRHETLFYILLLVETRFVNT